MPSILAAFFEFSGPAFWMSAPGLVLLVIGLLLKCFLDLCHNK
jgi:hypothetical protein